METCVYSQIESKDVDENINETRRVSNKDDSSGNNWRNINKPFIRQFLICCSLWISYFHNGLMTGTPTVLIPQYRRESNSTDSISDDMASWLYSIPSVASIPWIFILPLLMHVIGRKLAFVVLCVVIVTGFTVFYCSSTITGIMIGEVILGIAVTNTFTLSPVILTEYSSPRNRGVFLTMKSATFFWGIWVANAIGTFYHWRYITLLSLICSVYYVSVIFWPESPYWLATKGRFDECTNAYRWLHGTSRDVEIELQVLINSQREFLKNQKHYKSLFSKDNIIKIVKTITIPEFYKPLLICTLVFLLYFCSGKIVCSLYIIDIVKKITENEATAYKTMLILDGVTILSMYIGCAVSKYVKRRTFLFTTSLTAALFLCILSLYLYLIKLNILQENNYVTIFFLTMFTLSVSCGPMILVTSIYSELVPLRYKSSLICLSGLFLNIIYSLSLKMALTLFKSLGLHGTFLLYGLASSTCTLVLYKYLPETKDKTLQEIEANFKSNTKLIDKSGDDEY